MEDLAIMAMDPAVSLIPAAQAKAPATPAVEPVVIHLVTLVAVVVLAAVVPAAVVAPVVVVVAKVPLLHLHPVTAPYLHPRSLL